MAFFFLGKGSLKEHVCVLLQTKKNQDIHKTLWYWKLGLELGIGISIRDWDLGLGLKLVCRAKIAFEVVIWLVMSKIKYVQYSFIIMLDLVSGFFDSCGVGGLIKENSTK